MNPCANIATAMRRGTLPEGTSFRDPRRLGALASWSLREEALLTPKPGLVDRRGRGAHADMDLAMLLRSADALAPHFVRIAECADAMPFGAALRARLGVIGREAETAMLAVTTGVNTHRGAIWALGLLVAASASSTTANAFHAESPTISANIALQFDARAICGRAARIARLPALACTSTSHGSTMQERHGVRGARGEAEDAFPHIRAIALPALRAARVRYRDEQTARLHALIALIAALDDTCLLYRGGAEALVFAQQGARRALEYGLDDEGGWQALDNLDRGLLARNASPGGCADLLAATLFLDRVESLRIESATEAHDGNA